MANTVIESGMRVELDVTPDNWRVYWMKPERKVGAAVAAILATKLPIAEIRILSGQLFVTAMVPRDDVPPTKKLRDMRTRMMLAAKHAIDALSPEPL